MKTKFDGKDALGEPRYRPHPTQLRASSRLLAVSVGRLFTNWAIFGGTRYNSRLRTVSSHPIDMRGADDIVNLDFRQATSGDFAAMADAHRDSVLSLGAAHYPANVVNEWHRVIAPALYAQATERGEVFFIATGVFEGESRVLGFASDYVIDPPTHGTSAYVRGQAARRGIGSRVLAMSEDYAIRRGAREVRIEASLGAVPFYRANGFVETGRGDVELPSGARMSCVFMRKTLPAARE
jgi:GNAT superfamily N-acetyltransferase